MEYFAAWFVLSIVAAMIASAKGRSGLGFFLLSMFLSPLIGIVAAAIASRDLKRLDAEGLRSGEMRKCPDCAELVRYEAPKCRYCNAALPALGHPDPVAYRLGKMLGSMFSKPPAPR